MIRILLVDDQNLIQEGIKALLDQHTELKVIGTVKDGRNAIKLVGLLHPDIVLLDIEMPGMDGITVTKHITRIAPETKVIILTSYEDKKYVMQSLLAGARGYILKSSLMKDLKQAILAVDNGYCQLESRLLAKIFNSESIKSKKSKSSSISEIDENKRGKEHSTSNKDFVKHKLSKSEKRPSHPSDKKPNNFLNKEESEQSLLNSIDVSTESKNNEFGSPNFSTLSSSMHSILVTSEIKPVATFNTLFTPPQTQPVATFNTLFTPFQTQPVATFNTLFIPFQTQPIETSETSTTLFPIQAPQTQSIETYKVFDTPPQTQSIETYKVSDTPPQTQSIETYKVSDTPPQTHPIETSETFEISTTSTSSTTHPIETSEISEISTTSFTTQSIETQQEDIQNSKVPLLPVVNQMALSMASEYSSSPQDVTKKRKSNKLVAKTFALKNYFRQLVSKKNISRYKTNISILIFQSRLVLRQYRGKILQYTKLQISQSNQRSGKYQIKLTQYKSKLFSLIKYWYEKKIFSNIGLMILGAAIFFLIHSLFNR